MEEFRIADVGGETLLSAAKSVHAKDGMVLRPAAPWTSSVHGLLRHLEQKGFTFAPKVLGTGYAADGRETLSYVEGEFVHPGPWSDEGLYRIGRMLRSLHNAAADFQPPAEARWQPWFLRELGGGANRVFGHGDVAPWNVVTCDGLPVGLIDWEYAGPVDPMAELARVCWLFPQLHDDDVAALAGLPDLAARARQLRILADAYGVPVEQRGLLLDLIIQVAVTEAAEEAVELGAGPESHGPLWGIAWRTRAAAWMLRHRAVLEQALLE
ncbi:aminoglycoside phosphotransferase family protein [Paenibacillus sp. YN15]|uniref:aminoglycoside phosphotransferase family protein n=1 Tax=Paenibacillus sp. YN15 TaxID=1742774 RepID=UPI000DCD511D|nr:aminoglycoside phosphotransferase family protein [Paenibacillus sp. YN15]RAU91997.1 aminoglycoside phosphotransferase family protein [Paenibacillus sp. YN15]